MLTMSQFLNKDDLIFALQEENRQLREVARLVANHFEGTDALLGDLARDILASNRT